MTISFTTEEVEHLRSLIRITKDEDARVMQNVTVQAAEQKIIEIIDEKLNS